MLKWTVNMIDRIFAIAGALIFSQIPTFIQQYKQQLLGHIAELQIQISSIAKTAALSGKSLPEYIQKFTSNSDVDFSRHGEYMHQMTVRLHTLSEGYHSLNQASPFTKPFIFASSFYSDIAKSTYETFQFGLEFSVEGVIYALFGMIVGFSLFASFKALFSLIQRKVLGITVQF